jgi:predicted nucleotidyltransferase
MQNQRIVSLLRDHLDANLKAVYLFGSMASNQARADSDVDLAILTHSKPDPEVAFAAKTDLSALLKRDVDLVDLARADTVTKAQIVSSGIVLYSHDPSALAHYEVTCMSQYAALNEERAGILADIGARGTVYGR